MRRAMFRTLLTSAAVLAAAVIGAASAYAGEGFTPALDTSAQCEIRVDGSYGQFDALETEFERFKEYYPNAELTYTPVEDYNNAISQTFSTEEAPDLFFTFYWMLGDEKYKPLLENAENLADPSLNLDLGVIRKGLLSESEDGSVQMVPILGTTYCMLVNEDIFAQVGTKVPASYSELENACEDLQETVYLSPVMGYNDDGHGLTSSMFFPHFASSVVDDPDAMSKLNSLDPSAGEYMRPALDVLDDFMEGSYVDIVACEEIENQNDSAILRFFEGDVPMLFTYGEAVSLTGELENASDAYSSNNFTYRCYPIPTTDEGSYFLDVSAVELAVNKNSGNLDMANEFIRFLLNTEELNTLAKEKRLLTVSADLTFDEMFTAFSKVPEDYVLHYHGAGLSDEAILQCRLAAFYVGNGEMEPDDAIQNYGSLQG